MNANRNTWSGLSPFSALMVLFGGCVLVTSIGCNRGPDLPEGMPDLIPCTITVTYNGTAVEGANVLLSPQSGKYTAAGITDASGNAVMKTDAKYEGVVTGEYSASVTKSEDTGWVAPPQPDVTEGAQAQMAWEEELKKKPVPKALLPEKYGAFTTSGLTIAVSDGTPAEATFALTDDAAK